MVGRSPKVNAQGESPVELRGRETRQRLLTAAAELVPELGWSAVSTRAVAQRAGVRPGLVHYHFPSMTDLLVDATVPVLAALVDEMVAVLEPAADLPSGVDALLGAATGYAADYAAGEPVSRLTAEAFLAAARVPRLQRELSAVLGQARARLAEWLRRGGFAGDPEAVAVVLAAAFDGLILHRAVDPQTDLAGSSAVLRALVGGEPQARRS